MNKFIFFNLFFLCAILTKSNLTFGDALVKNLGDDTTKYMSGQNTGKNIRDFIANEWNISPDEIANIRTESSFEYLISEIDKDSDETLNDAIETVSFITYKDLSNLRKLLGYQS